LPLTAIHTILFNSLKATGATITPVLWNLGASWILALPLCFLFVKKLGWGLESVWGVYLVEETLKAGFMFHMWRRRNWSKNRLVS
jgi:Na+-driven multidrug efflux pump